MKLFFIIFTAIVSSLQTAESLAPETVLYNYGRATTDIKGIIKTMSSRFDYVNEQVDTLLVDLKHNITDLRKHYGISKFDYYQEKYSKNCSTYIKSIRKTNEWQQSALSGAIAESLKYWKDGYDNLNLIIIETRVQLANLEREAHTCGKQFNGSESPKPWECARQLFYKAKRMKFDVSYDIDDELQSVTERKDETIGKLYESLKKQKFFRFYDDEKVIDAWLTTNCSK